MRGSFRLTHLGGAIPLAGRGNALRKPNVEVLLSTNPAQPGTASRQPLANYSLGRSLQADALDFFGDATNYAISLGVAGMALAWRARAALFKAAAMLVFGIWVLAYAAYGLIAGSAPEPQTIGLVGTLALLVNLAVAMLLFRYRDGDANMRSVWICTRNDAIGNLAVLAAALGVFGSGQAWPDLIVASFMAILAIWGSIEVYTQARKELALVQGT